MKDIDMILIIDDVHVHITSNNVHIHDSYKITSDDIKRHILETITIHSDILKYRSFKSMLNEWKTHNILYQHNCQIDRTKHVDLDFKQSVFHKIAYYMIAHLFKERTHHYENL